MESWFYQVPPPLTMVDHSGAAALLDLVQTSGTTFVEGETEARWLFLGKNEAKLHLSHLQQRHFHEIQLLCDVWMWKREDEAQF
jgi:hypothetical protein